MQKIFKYASIYMQASLDLVQAFELAGKRIRRKRSKHMFFHAIGLLKAGKPVSEALLEFRKRKAIDAVCWSMLASSELSGNLATVFGEIAGYMKSQSAIRKTLVSSLAYPIGVIAASCMMVYFLMTVIFPKITPLFASLNAPLPPATKVLLFVSEFLRENTFHLLVGSSVCAVLAFGVYKRNDAFKRAVQIALLHAPLIAGILRRKELHRISTSNNFLMRSHRTLSDSMRLSRDTAPLVIFAETIDRTIARIDSGQRISETMRVERLFDDEWIDLVSVGESSGSLPQAFHDLSKFYEGQLKEEFERMARWAEPAALCGSAAVILLVALSVIQPMYSIISLVQRAG